jgi:hypothetical protein
MHGFSLTFELHSHNPLRLPGLQQIHPVRGYREFVLHQQAAGLEWYSGGGKSLRWVDVDVEMGVGGWDRRGKGREVGDRYITSE